MTRSLFTGSVLLGALWLGACASNKPGDPGGIDAGAPTGTGGTDGGGATGSGTGSGSGTQPAGSCSAVMIITARASTEAPGEGITGALVTQIVNASKQTVARASVDYPATLTNYPSSSSQGITALTAQLTTEVQNCPDQKVVLAGYSQGAHVVLDVLAGGQGGTLGTATPPIAASIASHVVAIVTFGDPRHVTNQPFDLGTSTNNGLFPRTAAQLQVLGGIASEINSFCDTDDEFCDSGTSLQVHLSYLDHDQNPAATFVLGKIGG